MARRFTLIHPDIGADEISAVSELLQNPEALPQIAYAVAAGGPVERIAREFIAFVAEGADAGDPAMVRAAKRSSNGKVNAFAGGFASATGALCSILQALGAGGGEVVTTSLNYVGVVNSIAMAGARPRFVDVDARSWCLDPKALEGALTKDTRAIILTHLNRVVDAEPIHGILESKGLDVPIVQDASLAVGSRLRGIRPGLANAGRGATVFSLATSKAISGLGGAVATFADTDLLVQALTVAYQGMNLGSADKLDRPGANFKMNDMNAAIALVQLSRREELFARRRELAGLYRECLADAVASERVVLQDAGDEAVLTHYAVLVRGRDALAARLAGKHGIPLGMWHLHHLQKPYRDTGVRLPATDALDGRIAFLPFHTRLSDEDVRFICDALLQEMG